jgi:RAQPRD family integrative conjugative element protein
MPLRRFALKISTCLCVVTLAAGFSASPLSAADSDLENEQLAALVRQLDILDRLAAQSALSSNTTNRYHFDYARLRQDVARMRTGIEEYLSPRRAQPRDPDSLSGEYCREAATSP